MSVNQRVMIAVLPTFDALIVGQFGYIGFAKYGIFTLFALTVIISKKQHGTASKQYNSDEVA